MRPITQDAPPQSVLNTQFEQFATLAARILSKFDHVVTADSPKIVKSEVDRGTLRLVQRAMTTDVFRGMPLFEERNITSAYYEKGVVAIRINLHVGNQVSMFVDNRPFLQDTGIQQPPDPKEFEAATTVAIALLAKFSEHLGYVLEGNKRYTAELSNELDPEKYNSPIQLNRLDEPFRTKLGKVFWATYNQNPV